MAVTAVFGSWNMHSDLAPESGVSTDLRHLNLNQMNVSFYLLYCIRLVSNQVNLKKSKAPAEKKSTENREDNKLVLNKLHFILLESRKIASLSGRRKYKNRKEINPNSYRVAPENFPGD